MGREGSGLLTEGARWCRSFPSLLAPALSPEPCREAWPVSLRAMVCPVRCGLAWLFRPELLLTLQSFMLDTLQDKTQIRGEVYTYDKASDTLVIKDHAVGLQEANYRFLKGKDVDPASVKLSGSNRVPEPTPSTSDDAVQRSVLHAIFRFLSRAMVLSRSDAPPFRACV